MEGEDWGNLFVLTLLIQEQVRFQLGSLSLGGFELGSVHFLLQVDSAVHHVVVLMSTDSAQEKAERFSGPAPHSCGSSSGESSTACPASWRLTQCYPACSSK